MSNNNNSSSKPPGQAPNPGQSASANSSVPWHDLLAQFGRIISELDMDAANARVLAMRVSHAEEPVDAQIDRLIRDKCLKTSTVGAVTSGAAIIPGIGTVVSLTAGVAADIGATFKLQAELVLEIAAARGHILTPEEKRTIVLLITGMSGGTNQALAQAGKQATIKITERYAQKWVAHALPFVGVAASAATNALTTYLVGRRADAYFRLGPEAIGDWGEIWRTITGVDERALGSWFTEQVGTSWRAMRSGASGATSSLAGAGTVAAIKVKEIGGEAVSKAGALADIAKDGAATAASRATTAASATGQAIGTVAATATNAMKQRVGGAAHRIGGLFRKNGKPEIASNSSEKIAEDQDSTTPKDEA